MKCPRCSNDLKVMSSGGVELNVCFGHCAGIWFDNFEIKKLDEEKEADDMFLAALHESKTLKVTQDKRLNCPKCKNIVMLRNFFSAKQAVEVDHCGGCGGYWLDAGELVRIHREYPDEGARRAAANQLFNEMFSAELEQMRGKSEAELKTARAVANAFKFLCPTAYIPGKQKWGAH